MRIGVGTKASSNALETIGAKRPRVIAERFRAASSAPRFLNRRERPAAPAIGLGDRQSQLRVSMSGVRFSAASFRAGPQTTSPSRCRTARGISGDWPHQRSRPAPRCARNSRGRASGTIESAAPGPCAEATAVSRQVACAAIRTRVPAATPPVRIDFPNTLRPIWTQAGPACPLDGPRCAYRNPSTSDSKKIDNNV